MRYFKHYPGDALIGTAALDDAQFTLYVRLWWLMQESGGPVSFDPQFLKHTLHKRPQDIRRLVDQLCKLGKLSIDAENRIHNRRVDRDIEEWTRNEAAKTAKQSTNGAANGSDESQKSEQNLRAHARSPAHSKESEAEAYRERSLSHGTNTAREPETLSQALARRLREEREKEEIGHDPGNQR